MHLIYHFLMDTRLKSVIPHKKLMAGLKTKFGVFKAFFVQPLFGASI
jgi:hypothetical protein